MKSLNVFLWITVIILSSSLYAQGELLITKDILVNNKWESSNSVEVLEFMGNNTLRYLFNGIDYGVYSGTYKIENNTVITTFNIKIQKSNKNRVLENNIWTYSETKKPNGYIRMLKSKKGIELIGIIPELKNSKTGSMKPSHQP